MDVSKMASGARPKSSPSRDLRETGLQILGLSIRMVLSHRRSLNLKTLSFDFNTGIYAQTAILAIRRENLATNWPWIQEQMNRRKIREKEIISLEPQFSIPSIFDNWKLYCLAIIDRKKEVLFLTANWLSFRWKGVFFFHFVVLRRGPQRRT